MKKRIEEITDTVVITDSSNKVKITSIENAFLHFGIKIKVIQKVLQLSDRPLTRDQTMSAAQNRVRKLTDYTLDENVIFISIQRGTTILDLNESSKFIVACAIYKPSIMGLIDVVFGKRKIRLPTDIREMVKGGIDIYEAYEKCFKIPSAKNTDWSLYEKANKVRGQTEILYQTKLIIEAIRPLITNGTAFKTF